MRRPWHTWILFCLFLTIVLCVMAWITTTVLRLQTANILVQQDAAIEETVRLALWRMDAAISPMVIEESSRPHTDYNAVNPMAQLFPNTAVDNAADLVPSPLLARPASNVVLYFNGLITTDDSAQILTSPQIPPEPLESWGRSNFNINDEILARNRHNLAMFTESVDIARLQRHVAPPALPGPQQQAAVAAANPGDPPRPEADRQAAQAAVNQTDQPQLLAANLPAQTDEPQQQAMRRQEELNAREYLIRQGQTAEAQQKVQQSRAVRRDMQNDPGNIWRPVKGGQPAAPPPQTPQHVSAQESVMRPVWIGDMLVLSRNVTAEDGHYVQGAWLDWRSIKAGLLADVSDLLPEADLIPVTAPEPGDRRRMLASLPVKLVPGPLAVAPVVTVTPLGAPLLVAWVSVIVSISAVTALLFGAVSLSERRAAFVSAVTHELRTPLTTFRIYTEMLAGDMITDREKRKSYLVTLNRESNRLGHLVENVLAYAGLERGSGARVMESLPAGPIIERIRPNLVARAQETGMQLLIESESPGVDAELHTDPSAVGQILTNLVDNACKYAAGAPDNRIHLSTRRETNTVVLRVKDHGPGLGRGEVKTVFKPFRKSAREAARSAPGVGLGLALCKRLAHQLGGDLNYERQPDGGACFCLRLPAQEHRQM